MTALAIENKTTKEGGDHRKTLFYGGAYIDTHIYVTTEKGPRSHQINRNQKAVLRSRAN